MGDYACFVVRCDPAKGEAVREELSKEGRDVKGYGCGLVMGFWKTSGGPSSIEAEIDGNLYRVPGLSWWQIVIVHESHNAVDEKTAVIQV